MILEIELTFSIVTGSKPAQPFFSFPLNQLFSKLIFVLLLNFQTLMKAKFYMHVFKGF